MPRTPRIEYPGAIYHLMNRGNQLRRVFWDDADRKAFLTTLAEACRRTGWRVHGFALMPNHYHLLVGTPRANLVRGMQWLNSTYTLRFNSRHRKRGHLFQGRYKALMVEAGDEGYFLAVSDYVHLNPLRAGLVGGATEAEKWRRFWDYPWSSASVFGRIGGRCPPWLEWEAVFHVMGIGRDDATGRRLFRETLEERWGDASLRASWKEMRRGWFWGGVDFREKLLERLRQMKGRAKERNWSGTLVEESEERRAERLYARGIKALRDLGHVDGKGMGGKLDWRRQWLAWWIFGRSRVTLEWVAHQVGMGHESNVSHAWKNMEERVKKESLLRKLEWVAENPKSKD